MLLPAGRLFAAAVVPVLLVATGVVVPALMPLGVAVFGLLLIAAVIDGVRAGGVELAGTREWPDLLVQGQASSSELVIDAEPHRRCDLEIHETLHPAVAAEPFRERLSLPASSAARRHRLSVPLTPRWRGEHRVGPLVVRKLGPWRLAWRQRVLLEGETVRVFPQVRWGGRVGQLLRLSQRNALGALALARSGEGGEPYSLRRYVVGDSLSQVHWKATARRGHLVSRENRWERGAPLVLLLDCGRGMASLDAGRSKLDHALAACLALCRVASSRGDRVKLVAFSDRIERRVAIGGGRGDVARAYGSLYDLQARLAESSFELVVDAVAQLQGTLGALHGGRVTVVIFTSVVDLGASELLRESLQRLGRRYRVLLLNLEDPVIRDLAHRAPDSEAMVHAKVASLEILIANRRLGRRLRRAGVHTVSTSADRLALETLESYLRLLSGRAAA